MTSHHKYNLSIDLFLLVLVLTIGASTIAIAQEKSNKAPVKEVIKSLLDSAKVIANKDLLLAIPVYKNALMLSKDLKLQQFQAEAYYGILNIYYKRFDYQTTDKFADSILAIAPSQQYKMLAIERKGDVKWYIGAFDSAAHYYHQVKHIAEEIGDSTKLATIQRDLGDYYRQIGDYRTAIFYFDNSISLLKEMNDTTLLSGVYNNFSIVFSSMGDYHKQLEYLLKAVEIRKSSENYAVLALYNKNIADVYITLKEYETALLKSKEANELLKKSPFLRFDLYVKEVTGRVYYHLKAYDSSKYYFEKALILCDSLGEKRYQARIIKCLGDLAAEQTNYFKANEYYQKSLSHYQFIDDPVYEVKTYVSIAKNYFQIAQEEKAYLALQKAKDIALSFGNKGVLLEIYQLLASYDESQNNLKSSLENMKKLDSLKNIVFNEDRAKYIAHNEIVHETKKREIENISLKQNIAHQNAVFSKQTTRIKLGTIIILAFIIFALVLYYAYRKTRISKLKVAVQNKQLQLKNKEIEKANQQQMDLIHLVAHDLKSPLNKIIGLANILKLESKLTREQEEIIDMMENISSSSRNFIINLLEAQDVERMALEPHFKLHEVQQIFMEAGAELQQLVQVKNQHAILENKIHSSLFFEIDKELMHHILLNLFSNAIKFSPPGTKIYFRIRNDEQNIYLTVKDEGPGFTKEDEKKIYSKFQKLSAKPTNQESSTGLGLYLVKSLVLKMKGQINLIPSDLGAHFEIRFNYKK